MLDQIQLPNPDLRNWESTALKGLLVLALSLGGAWGMSILTDVKTNTTTLGLHETRITITDTKIDLMQRQLDAMDKKLDRILEETGTVRVIKGR